MNYDLAVIGAGPAGIKAAITAARLGMRVTLLEQNKHPGGAMFPEPINHQASANQKIKKKWRQEDQKTAQHLFTSLKESTVDTRYSARVWNIRRGFTIWYHNADEVKCVEAKRIILASGSRSLGLPIRGAILPQVEQLDLAARSLKQGNVFPQKKPLVAGAGPLVYYTAQKLLNCGIKPVAVVDTASTLDWLKEIKRFAGHPEIILRGLIWLIKLKLASVPVLRGWALTHIEGGEKVTGAQTSKLAPNKSLCPEMHHFECDSVIFGYGLMPDTRLARLLGAELDYKTSRGGWYIKTNRYMRTSVKKLYCAGDAGGVFGITIAQQRGELAAYKAALDARFISANRFRVEAADIKEKLPRTLRYGRALNRLSVPANALFDAVPQESYICPCEAVSRQTVEQSIDAGAKSVEAIKSATGAGMGHCNGHKCHTHISRVLYAKTGTSQPPPVTLAPIDTLAVKVILKNTKTPDPGDYPPF